MHLLLVRHGATDWNAQGRLQGQTDVPLSAEGRRQVALVAPYFRLYAPDLLWVSPLRRARESAAILADTRSPEARIDARLMERSFGILEGLSRSEQTLRHPDVREALRKDYLGYTPPGGESYLAFWRRVEGFWGELRPEAERVAVVAHGGTIRIILGLALGTDAKAAPRFRLDNARMSLLRLEGQGAFLEEVNVWPSAEAPDLTPPRATP